MRVHQHPSAAAQSQQEQDKTAIPNPGHESAG